MTNERAKRGAEARPMSDLCVRARRRGAGLRRGNWDGMAMPRERGVTSLPLWCHLIGQRANAQRAVSLLFVGKRGTEAGERGPSRTTCGAHRCRSRALSTPSATCREQRQRQTHFQQLVKKERKKTDNPREGWCMVAQTSHFFSARVPVAAESLRERAALVSSPPPATAERHGVRRSHRQDKEVRHQPAAAAEAICVRGDPPRPRRRVKERPEGEAREDVQGSPHTAGSLRGGRPVAVAGPSALTAPGCTAPPALCQSALVPAPLRLRRLAAGWPPPPQCARGSSRSRPLWPTALPAAAARAGRRPLVRAALWLQGCLWWRPLVWLWPHL